MEEKERKRKKWRVMPNTNKRCKEQQSYCNLGLVYQPQDLLDLFLFSLCKLTPRNTIKIARHRYQIVLILFKILIR